jgi:AcrR family transcriptional regulator
MAEPAPATEQNEARRIGMLRAAAELICERGFGDTRIADVAKRAGVSSALVIYYFGTRDRLLVDALRYSEESFYEAAEQMLAELPSLRERLSLLIRWTCVPEGNDEIPGFWGLWFDLWAQAFRHDEIKAGRVELDARWRKMIVDAIKSAELIRRVNARCSRWSSPPCSMAQRSRSPWTTRRSTPTSPTKSRCTLRSANSTCRRRRSG